MRSPCLFDRMMEKNDGIRIAQCDGKKRFDNHEQAAKVAARKSRRHEIRPRVYRCQYCGGYHVGSGNISNTRRRIKTKGAVDE